MKHYIGIDLGTTNSVICSYDGTNVRIWKSPEQNDVTPSAINIDKRGNRYYGQKAYIQALYNPTNSATLFKRYLGTNKKYVFESSGLVLTPEECSAEILKLLYGYLPEEIRNNNENGVVISVPATFNQMKKDATSQAAKSIGINNVTLIQEPIAAIMSIMKTTKQEGIFIVYDLGGGTFDVSIAENINNKINILTHDGMEMCGGRDIDRLLFNQIVVPWLHKTFELPEDFLSSHKYKSFCRIALWATERAKIQLSSMDKCTIALNEDETMVKDEKGTEINIDISINRNQVNDIIFELINETVEKIKETLNCIGLSSNDIKNIVFIGGPTNYKPLRDIVTNKLSISGNIDVNPMTSVAEGASIYAESIDWNTTCFNRKITNKSIKTYIPLTFNYTNRTSSEFANIICLLENDLNNLKIQFTSDDTGWSSGDAILIDKLTISLPLHNYGDNVFSIKVFNEHGIEQQLGLNKITITKSITTIGFIPASQSIGISVLNKLGGTSVLEFLVKEGDSLPKKGTVVVKSGQTLKAGSNNSLNFKLWEGNIESPVEDNRWIGMFKITGTDIDEGIIPTGADIECEYEISDSGTITMIASIPCIGVTFNKHNFYSRQEGQVDLDNIDNIAEQGRDLFERINNLSEIINDSQLERAKVKVEKIANLDSQPQCEAEDVQKANNDLLEAKKIINKLRKSNLKAIRKIELDKHVNIFNETVCKYASDDDKDIINNLIKSAQVSIEYNDDDFDNILYNLKNKNLIILFRQDWFVIDWYNNAVANPYNYIDKQKYSELKKQGDIALLNDNIDELRQIIYQLVAIQIYNDSGDGMFDDVNIIRG